MNHHPSHPVQWEGHEKILTDIKTSLEIPLFTHYKHKFIIPVDTSMGATLNKDDGEELPDFQPRTLERAYKEVTKRWLPVVDQKLEL